MIEHANSNRVCVCTCGAYERACTPAECHSQQIADASSNRGAEPCDWLCTNCGQPHVIPKRVQPEVIEDAIAERERDHEIEAARVEGRATLNRVPDDATAIGEIAHLLMVDQNAAGGLVPSVQRWLVKTGYVQPGRGGLRDAIRKLQDD